MAVVALLLAGCTHETYLADSKHPEVAYTEAGELKWHDRFIEPEELPRLFDAGVPDLLLRLRPLLGRPLRSVRPPCPQVIVLVRS